MSSGRREPIKSEINLRVSSTVAKQSRIAQTIFDRLLSVTGSYRPSAKLSGLALRLARKALVKSSDPLITYELSGQKLLLPLSHELPFFRAKYPSYSVNVGRICRHIKDAYPATTVVDIGANVGDTVAIVRGFVNCPILCVEGNPKFLPLLESNAERLGGDVEIAATFVGDESTVAKLSPSTEGGTAHLVVNEGGNEVQVKSLQDILQAHPRFAAPRLLKIDTDGFDNKIIRGAAATLASSHPILFFEYDPHFLAKQNEDGREIFTTLSEIGYDRMMVYTNLGDYLLTCQLSDTRLIDELHQFVTGRAGLQYFDLCVFAPNDSPIAESIRAEEFRLSEKR